MMMKKTLKTLKKKKIAILIYWEITWNTTNKTILMGLILEIIIITIRIRILEEMFQENENKDNFNLFYLFYICKL